MTVARYGQAAVRLADGRVLVMGGTVPFTPGTCEMACIDPATASVEVYDPSTGEFSHNGSLAEPRTDVTWVRTEEAALLLNDGRVLVSGGSNGSGVSISTIEIYDPTKGTSVVVKPPADIGQLPSDHTVVLLADGRVLIAGGSYDDDVSASSATLIFDPASGGFSNGPLMAKPRQGASATLLDDGRVLMVGGDDPGDAELIDPSHLLARSALLASQDSVTSTLLSDGRVLVAGGADCIPTHSEVFDPIADRFTPVGPMNTPRGRSAAIKIQDGRVLFLGGQDSHCVAVSTVEAFDPDSGTFQVIATGFPNLTEFSATLLDDGEILVGGGHSGNDYDPMKATWLLKP